MKGISRVTGSFPEVSGDPLLLFRSKLLKPTGNCVLGEIIDRCYCTVTWLIFQ